MDELAAEAADIFMRQLDFAIDDLFDGEDAMGFVESRTEVSVAIAGFVRLQRPGEIERRLPAAISEK